MTAASEAPDGLLDHDWLGACRRAARGPACRAAPSTRRAASASSRPATTRRGRRPDARHRRGGRGRASSPSSSGCTRRARASPPSPRSAAIVDFGDPDVLVVIDPIDGSLNAKRGLHAPRAVDRRRRRADDGRRRLRLRLRPRARARSGARSRGEGAYLNDERARRPAARAPHAATAGSSSSPSSRPTRAGWPPSSGDLVRRDAPRARDGLDRDLAVPGRRHARRRDGDAVEVPRGRRRGGAARSCARAAASSRSRRAGDPLGAPLDLEPHCPVVAARTARGAGASSRSVPAVLSADARLDARRARRRLAPAPPARASRRGAAAAARRPRRARAAGARARSSRYDRARARRGRCRPLEAVDRAAWADANLATMRSTLGPAASSAWSSGTGALAGPLQGAGGRGRRRRGRRAASGLWPAACSASTSSPCSTREAPARLLFVGAQPRATPRASWTSTASELVTWVVAPRGHPRGAVRARWPGCASTSAALLRELLGGAGRRASTRGAAAAAARRRPRGARGTAARGRPGRGRRRARAPRDCSTACRRRWRSSRATPSTSMDARRRDVLRDLDGAARRAGPPPRASAPPLHAHARAAARPRAQAAPVRGRAGASATRSSCARGDRRRSTAPGRAASCCPTLGRAGRSGRLAARRTRAASAAGPTRRTGRVTVASAAVYKHVFGGTLPDTSYELTSFQSQLRHGREHHRSAPLPPRPARPPPPSRARPPPPSARRPFAAGKTAATRRSTRPSAPPRPATRRAAEATPRRAASTPSAGRASPTSRTASSSVGATSADVEQAGDVAERVVLTSVGAALVARDSVVERARSCGHAARRPERELTPLRAPRHHRPQPLRARGQEDPHARRARAASAPHRASATSSAPHVERGRRRPSLVAARVENLRPGPA